jgi:excisionase family DNA binding protein
VTASTGTDGVSTNERFYTPVEIAALLGVHRRTIITWLRDPDHVLEGVKLGNNTWRVPESSYKAYLEMLYGKQSA